MVCDGAGIDDIGGLWRGHADADAVAAYGHAGSDRHPCADGYAATHGDDDGFGDGDRNADVYTYANDDGDADGLAYADDDGDAAAWFGHRWRDGDGCACGDIAFCYVDSHHPAAPNNTWRAHHSTDSHAAGIVGQPEVAGHCGPA